MSELILFHHAQDLTGGVRGFAGELRAAGHLVHVPDLYEGGTFAELADGVAQAREIGFETIVERGRRAADGLPGDRHLFSDRSLPDHDDGAATLLMRRLLDFLAGP